MTQSPDIKMTRNIKMARKTAEYYRDRDGVLWKRLCNGWKKMKEAKRVKKK